VHVLNPGRQERVCLLQTRLERECISDMMKTREHSLVTGEFSVHISVSARALHHMHVVEQTEEHAVITGKNEERHTLGGQAVIPYQSRK
jgi:hypothetical protein